MWSFLWRPGWILTHLLVITMVVVMVNLGLWQVRRLEERRSVNATIEARQDEPPVPLSDLLPVAPGSGGAVSAAEATAAAEAVAFRPVLVEGRYQASQQVLVRNRSYGGAPGYWVLTPLVLSDGSGAVAVNRGWVPFAGTDPDGADWDAFAPPEGTVQISGMVREADLGGDGLAPAPGTFTQGVKNMAGVDLWRLSAQVSVPLYPLYVDMASQQPAQPTNLPVPVPTPELSEGSHLGYAGQWFIFSLLTVVVYGVMLRRVAQGRARSAPQDAQVA